MAFADSSTKWIKFGNLNKVNFVGKEVVCYSNGCHILFINVNTKEEVIYTANNIKMGDGVRCCIGHRFLSVFAFAESCANPTIFVYTYPEFTKIHDLKNGSAVGYIMMTFTDTSWLVTMGDLPDFLITTWNWRNGQKLSTLQTDILTTSQTLKASFGKPTYLSQLAINTRQVNIWDILMCGTSCTKIHHVITSPSDTPPFSNTLWSAEGACFILDVCGNVYSITNDHKTEKVIEVEEMGTYDTSFTWYKAGLAVTGPNQEIRHYRKAGDWSVTWRFIPPEPVMNITSNTKDCLVATTYNGNILSIDLETSSFQYLKKDESRFSYVVMIYPTGEYILTLSHSNELICWGTVDGLKKSSVSLRSPALVLKSNPDYPYVAVGYDDGMMEWFSVYNPTEIKSMLTFQLTRNPINSIHFTQISKIIVAANLHTGQFFILEGVPGTKVQVVGTVEVKHQIADYILVASQTCYRLFVLLVTSDEFIAGNRIIRYCVIKGKPHSEVKEFVLENTNQLYSKLYSTIREDRDRIFFAIPFKSRQIHVIETKRGETLARVIKRVSSGHQMGKIQLFSHEYRLISYAFDGLVILRSFNDMSMVAAIMPHHRREGGILKAAYCPLSKYIVTIGRDQNLVCTSLEYVEVNAEQQATLRQKLYSETYQKMFSRRTLGFSLKGKYEGKTWVEVTEMQTIEKETQLCKNERESIRNEFKCIQHDLQNLLTKNLEGPENERIPMQEFNLETDYAQEQRERSKIECKRAKLYLEKLIEVQDQVAKWCIKNFYDKMSVQGKSLWAIFDNFSVQNYVLLKVHGSIDEEFLRRIEAQRHMEELMAKYDRFQPYVPLSPSVLEEKLQKVPILAKLDEGPNINTDIDDDEEKEKDEIDILLAKTGSVACNFIELNPWHYPQEDVMTYWQCYLQTSLALTENIRLKEHFNKHFETMHSQKVREMVNINERYARLRHIISEINYFSENKLHIMIEDTEWRQDENPELIIKVDKKEVGITPYISPSEQAILDAKAAEEERIRLLLLADDFRERALMAMMNGVLEIRWEDELKKDVPPPKCMTEKPPEQYNEEDLRAIKDYEEKVEFLQSERERYMNMLYAEYAKLSNTTREGMKKFNERLADLFQKKTSVDMGIVLQNLLVARYRSRQFDRKMCKERRDEIRELIEKNNLKIAETQRTLNFLLQFVQECRTNLEALHTKEKVLERTFKKEFLEMTLLIQEAALKLYRKRPKIGFKQITQPDILNELAKCIVNQEVTVIVRLSNDSMEYLKAVSNLDLFIGIPAAMDERTYSIICRHRRTRIENEIKIRSATIYLNESEQTVTRFKERMTRKRAAAAKLQQELMGVFQENIDYDHNLEVQIAIRRGFVEIATTGDLSDYSEAILVHRKVVEDVNKQILQAGEKKLHTMKQTLSFHRKILCTEWKHERMRMRIQDLREQVRDIFAVKVTKEVQGFLRSRARGKADKGLSFEQEVEVMKESYEQVINERKAKVYELQKQINVVKRENKVLDEHINNVNVDVCEFKMKKDEELETLEQCVMKNRTATLLKRAKLVKEIQQNHNEILVLQTELELLRLKTYPTLKYKILT